MILVRRPSRAIEGGDERVQVAGGRAGQHHLGGKRSHEVGLHRPKLLADRKPGARLGQPAINRKLLPLFERRQHGRLGLGRCQPERVAIEVEHPGEPVETLSERRERILAVARPGLDQVILESQDGHRLCS